MRAGGAGGYSDLRFRSGDRPVKLLSPRLETLAVASIYGATDHYRTACVQPMFGGFITEQIGTCMVQFEHFANALQLRHLCIRDLASALVFPNSPHSSPRPPKEHHPITTTIHIGENPTYIPIPLGYPVRYTIDAKKRDDWGVILDGLQFGFKRVSGQRKEDKRDGYAFRPADLEVFCSTEVSRSGDFTPTNTSFGLSLSKFAPYFFSPADQVDRVERLQRCLQGMLRRDSGLADTVIWRVGQETPVCRACGSGRPT